MSHEEVSEILSEAIATHSRRHAALSVPLSLEDAVEIGRQLDIPEAEIRAAADRVRVRRKQERRELAIRRSKRSATVKAVGLLAYLGIWPLISVLPPELAPLQMALLVLFWGTPIFLIARWGFYTAPPEAGDKE